MTGKPPIELKTDAQILRFTLDVVIPAMRQMDFREDMGSLEPSTTQVLFESYGNKYAYLSERTCGSFACLGGWFERMSGEDSGRLRSAYYALAGSCSKDMCHACHEFSDDGTAREELEARAAAIAEVLEGIE